MVRYKIIVEYDGSFFCGWQSQASDSAFLSQLTREFFKNENHEWAPCPKPSVQGVLEKAVENLTGLKILVEGAGRTDAGVHALNQVAHFDLPMNKDLFQLRAGLNFYLRGLKVSILEVSVVEPTFHARFSAIKREYQYIIVNRRAPLALEENKAWHVGLPLNVEAMQEASHLFEGYHNFDSFRSRHCQAANPCRTLLFFVLQKMNNDHIQAIIQAPSFLHNQVRIMMGTLVLIGKGKLPASSIQDLLQNPDRTKAGPTAPPGGLYLTNVFYS